MKKIAIGKAASLDNSSEAWARVGIKPSPQCPKVNELSSLSQGLEPHQAHDQAMAGISSPTCKPLRFLPHASDCSWACQNMTCLALTRSLEHPSPAKATGAAWPSPFRRKPSRYPKSVIRVEHWLSAVGRDAMAQLLTETIPPRAFCCKPIGKAVQGFIPDLYDFISISRFLCHPSRSHFSSG